MDAPVISQSFATHHVQGSAILPQHVQHTTFSIPLLKQYAPECKAFEGKISLPLKYVAH